MCKNFTPPYKSDCVSINRSRCEINKKILSFFTEVKRLVIEKKCNLETFKLDILNINKLNLVHLEILWYLEEYSLISLSEIIQHYEDMKNDELIKHISEQVIAIISAHTPSDSVIKTKMTKCYLKTIFSNMSNLESLNVKYSIQQNILQFIVTCFTDYYASEAQDMFPLFNKVKPEDLVLILNEAELEVSVLNLLYDKIIGSLLEGSPQSVKNIFKAQENLESKLKEGRVYQFLTTISKHCEVNRLINVLKIKLYDSSKTINWNNALSLIVFLGTNYPEGWKMLKSLCEDILKEAFLKLEVKLLASAFVIARQGCSEKPKNAFQSYTQWFSSTFSSKSRTSISSRKTCLFFIDMLTDLVTVDSVKYLKVHINKTPYVPADCTPILDEYVNLVKNQLIDMNASTELGICENTTEKSTAAFDVETVVKHFETTNTVLNSVFQAAMFNRNYYEKKFIVELLSKFDGKNSARHKLIQKLNTFGKIPKSAFNKYKKLMEKK
ncbi:hypothetical protein RUM43_002162 [Polyplax serrata]|uniref:Uncharacterized protein n=1 Tax=Polyplax serrata TaxID=468196 RepID=A0AAN8NU62_POLSC